MKKALILIFCFLFLTSCAGDIYKGNKYLAHAGTSKNSGVQIAWSNISLDDAKQKALSYCNKRGIDSLYNKILGDRVKKNSTCYVRNAWINPNHPGTQNEIAAIKQKKAEQIAEQKN